MTPKLQNPFIVGDWIKRDEDFIGRADLIQKYLALDRQYYWLIGSRRMGKTSLLRYLQRQFLIQTDTLPLFWDVSGANTAYDLKLSFLDALDSSIFTFESRGIELPVQKLENESLLEILRWLIRETSRKSLRLIFLIDESEALFKVATHDPQFIQRFKAIMLNHPLLNIILASNHGLMPCNSLSTEHLMAPLLQAFLPPDYLNSWTIDETRQFLSKCLTQEAEQDLAMHHTGCLPFLVQMVCFYHHEIQDLRRTFDHINQHNILDLFFRDDFHQLQQENCDTLAIVTENEPVDIQTLTQILQVPTLQIQTRLTALYQLGFVHSGNNQKYCIKNQFLKEWIIQHYLTTSRKSILPKINPDAAVQPQQVVIDLSAADKKIIVYQNNKPVYENQMAFQLLSSLNEFGKKRDLKTIKNIGQRLYHDIFGSFEDPFIQELFQNTGSRLDLIFIEKKPQFFPLPYEFLHDGEQFLAVKHGLYRMNHPPVNGDKKTGLFEQPLNILLFASNTPPDIPHVDNEIILLRDEFYKIARELSIELKITVIPSHESDYLTWINLLQTSSYQIIHYAGHCGRDENSATEFIYLREQSGENSRVKALACQNLSKMLNKNTQLFYLNTCNSSFDDSNIQNKSHSGFASSIMAAGVKAFIGNCTAVNDRFSAEFARDFYWQLFSCQFNLAKAMQMTRLKWSQQTRYQEGGHLFWLFPILIQN